MKSNRKFHITKSMLFQLFISYICILAFTLFASSVLHYQTTNILKEENNRANDAILKQFSSALDDKLNYMTELAIQAYAGVESEIYSGSRQRKLSPYVRYRACNFLKNLNIATENVENIFIYYHNENYIISLSSSVSPDVYYQSYYQLKDFSLEDWNDILYSSSSGFIVFPSKAGANSIAFVYRPARAGVNRQNKVFVSFNPSKLQELLDNSKWANNGAFLVYSPEGKLLASTNPDYNDIDLSGYFDIDGFFNLKYEDKEYICKIIQSDNTKCYYVSITPKELATKPISSLKDMGLIFAVIIIPIGLAISYLLSRRNYTPLKRLLVWINEKAMYDPESFEQGNEIDILEKVLRLSFEEQEKLIAQIHNRKNELIISSMRNLLYGTYSEDDSVEEIFKRNDLTLLSNQFAVILINIERKYNSVQEALYSQDLLGFIITNVIEELAAKKHQGFVIPIDSNRYSCLVNFSSNDISTMQQDLLSIAQEGKKFLEENFGIYFTISLSAIHSELDGIHQAFQEALYAMEYRLTVGSNQIIPYKEESQYDSIYTFSFKTDHSINLFIKEPKDDSQINSFVRELFENRSIDSNTPPAVARDFMHDVAGSLCKAINDMLPQNTPWKENIYNRLIDCDTLEMFRNELINILKEYQEYLIGKSCLYSISAQVRKYIEENFHDPNLSVNTLGDKFNLSPSYLSKMFKDENEISIPDYITKIRIDNAKKLLKDTDKTIQKIAEETGFLSSSVFIRVFKKVEGITPGAYRKLYES